MTLTGLRVLIVEDEAIAAMMLQDWLENLAVRSSRWPRVWRMQRSRRKLRRLTSRHLISISPDN
jgi:CheY-like chemotaxis protein